MKDKSQLRRAISDYIAGDQAAGDRIYRILLDSVEQAVSQFYPKGNTDRDDIIQSTMLAMLSYLRKAGSCPENPKTFIVTIARNRCRNLYRWHQHRSSVDIDAVAHLLPDNEASPSDLLDRKERIELLAQAMKQLDQDCAKLLKALYLEEKTVEAMRQEAGLVSVQGIYYRKYLCLKNLTKLFNRRIVSGPSRRG